MHSAIGDNVTLSIDVPGSESGVLNQGHWMTDVYIQYRPELFRNFSGRDFLWQIPKRNSTIQRLFCGRASRVNARRFPSVLMYSGSSVQHLHRDNYLRIDLPDEFNLFFDLIAGERWMRPGKGQIHQVRLSEKGRYLSGVLELFSGLPSAYWTLREDYWQSLFKELSLSESRAQDAPSNKVRKILRSYNHNDIANENISIQKIINEAKKWFITGREISFEDLIRKASKMGIDVDWQGIEHRVPDFIEANILRVGLKPKCPHCGYRVWYHIDEIKQINECKGCGTKFSLHQREQSWYLKLNSLIQAGLAEHGLLPVILTLGQLLEESRTSFIFIPCLDLFDCGQESEESKQKLLGDLDIVCIRDGQLIIGEVKQSDSLYKPKHFEKMATVAKEIKPDELIFSALNIDRNNFLQIEAAKLHRDLSPIGIKVRAIQLETVEALKVDSDGLNETT